MEGALVLVHVAVVRGSRLSWGSYVIQKLFVSVARR